MSRLKFIKTVRPNFSAKVLIFLTIVLIIIACGWEKLLQISALNQYIGQSVIQIVSTLCFICILWRFGWLRASGFIRIGQGRTWIIIIFPLIYVLTKDIYLITGDLSFDFPNPHLIFWLSLSSLTTSLFEETLFRGLVLFSFLLLWDHSKFGIVKSITVSASLFGGIHVLQLAENPLPQTLLIMLTAVLGGFFYGVILLHGGSIWIPIVFHGLHNAGVNLFTAGWNFTEKPLINFFILMTYIPVFLLGVYLLKKLPQKNSMFPLIFKTKINHFY